jgi:hypothetical protein
MSRIIIHKNYFDQLFSWLPPIIVALVMCSVSFINVTLLYMCIHDHWSPEIFAIVFGAGLGLDLITIMMCHGVAKEWIDNKMLTVKVPVDASNIFEISDKLKELDESINWPEAPDDWAIKKQVSVLTNKWMNPSSDGTGYIFIMWPLNKPVPDVPYRHRLIHRMFLWLL